MSLPSVAWAMLRGQPPGADARERLDAFYAPQAASYDRTRERLLLGRRELVERMPAGGVLVDLGGGTGYSLELFGNRLRDFRAVHLVDLCAPLLAEAERRRERHRWGHVSTTQGDSRVWRPPEPVDCVHISYSLTMVPDWFDVIDNALAMLKPGGVLGVVDFYVSPKNPPPERVRHPWLVRHFWRVWFDHDGVHPSPDHLPYLCSRCDAVDVIEDSGPALGISFLRLPYYVFVGRKRAGAAP